MDGLTPSQSIIPRAGPGRPSKVISLKIQVSDHDLTAGKFRAEALPPPPSSLRLLLPPVSDPAAPRRRRRGRPRKASVLAAMIAAQTSRSELEPEPESERAKLPSPLPLSDFHAVSPYSFPLLITPPRSVQTPDQHALAPSTWASASIASAALSKDSGPQPINHVGSDSMSTSHNITTNSTTTITPLLPRLNLNEEPNTAEFKWDKSIANQAQNSNDVDFKMLCLKLIRWREQNAVPRPSSIQGIGWDVAVADAAARGKAWRRARRQREGRCRKAAGWAVWEGRKRSESRGRFVEDGPRGAWVLRAPGDDGEVVRVLRLGYKRMGRLMGDGTYDTGIAEHWVDVEELRDGSEGGRKGLLG